MFTERERASCLAAFEAGADDAQRLVLADALMERGERAGELLRLQLADRPEDEARIDALLAELGPRWRDELYPAATEVAVHRGLPFSAQLDPAKLARLDADWQDPPWPLERVVLADEPAPVFQALRAPLFQRVRDLDLSGSRFETGYVQFLDGTPLPVPRLERLARLAAPPALPPPHWLPLLAETFSAARVLVLRGHSESLEGWLPLLPSLREVDLGIGAAALDPQLRAEALRFVAGAPGRALRINGVQVTAAELDDALPQAPPAAPVALRDVADPPRSRAKSVVEREVLSERVGLFDASVDGQRGTWLRLSPRLADFHGQVELRLDVRLLLMAPRHPHLATGLRAVEHGGATWVLLGEGLRPLVRPAAPAEALRAALALGAGLGALADFLALHAPLGAFPFPLDPDEVLRGPDGVVRVLPPRPNTRSVGRRLPSLGIPTQRSPRGLALFLALVLAGWLHGRPLVRVSWAGLSMDRSWAEHELLFRFLDAPHLPAGLEPRVARLLERALSVVHAERLTLAQLLEGLEALALP